MSACVQILVKLDEYLGSGQDSQGYVKLDIDDNFIIAFTKVMKERTTLGQLKTDFGFATTLPLTKTNLSFVDCVLHPGIDYCQVEAIVYASGASPQRVLMDIKECTEDGISIAFDYKANQWVLQATECYLKDLEMDPIVWGRAYIESTLSDTGEYVDKNTPVQFPVINWGDIYSRTGEKFKRRIIYPTEYFRPFFHVTYLLQRAFAKLGIAVKSNLFESTFGKRLITYILDRDLGALEDGDVDSLYWKYFKTLDDETEDTGFENRVGYQVLEVFGDGLSAGNTYAPLQPSYADTLNNLGYVYWSQVPMTIDTNYSNDEYTLESSGLSGSLSHNFSFTHLRGCGVYKVQGEVSITIEPKGLSSDRKDQGTIRFVLARVCDSSDRWLDREFEDAMAVLGEDSLNIIRDDEGDVQNFEDTTLTISVDQCIPLTDTDRIGLFIYDSIRGRRHIIRLGESELTVTRIKSLCCEGDQVILSSLIDPEYTLMNLLEGLEVFGLKYGFNDQCQLCIDPPYKHTIKDEPVAGFIDQTESLDLTRYQSTKSKFISAPSQASRYCEFTFAPSTDPYITEQENTVDSYYGYKLDLGPKLRNAEVEVKSNTFFEETLHNGNKQNLRNQICLNVPQMGTNCENNCNIGPRLLLSYGVSTLEHIYHSGENLGPVPMRLYNCDEDEVTEYTIAGQYFTHLIDGDYPDCALIFSRPDELFNDYPINTSLLQFHLKYLYENTFRGIVGGAFRITADLFDQLTFNRLYRINHRGQNVIARLDSVVDYSYCDPSDTLIRFVPIISLSKLCEEFEDIVLDPDVPTFFYCQNFPTADITGDHTTGYVIMINPNATTAVAGIDIFAEYVGLSAPPLLSSTGGTATTYNLSPPFITDICVTITIHYADRGNKSCPSQTIKEVLLKCPPVTPLVDISECVYSIYNIRSDATVTWYTSTDNVTFVPVGDTLDLTQLVFDECIWIYYTVETPECPTVESEPQKLFYDFTINPDCCSCKILGAVVTNIEGNISYLWKVADQEAGPYSDTGVTTQEIETVPGKWYKLCATLGECVPAESDPIQAKCVGEEVQTCPEFSIGVDYECQDQCFTFTRVGDDLSAWDVIDYFLIICTVDGVVEEVKWWDGEPVCCDQVKVRRVVEVCDTDCMECTPWIICTPSDAGSDTSKTIQKQ